MGRKERAIILAQRTYIEELEEVLRSSLEELEVRCENDILSITGPQCLYEWNLLQHHPNSLSLHLNKSYTGSYLEFHTNSGWYTSRKKNGYWSCVLPLYHSISPIHGSMFSRNFYLNQKSFSRLMRALKKYTPKRYYSRTISGIEQPRLVVTT